MSNNLTARTDSDKSLSIITGTQSLPFHYRCIIGPGNLLTTAGPCALIPLGIAYRSGLTVNLEAMAHADIDTLIAALHPHLFIHWARDGLFPPEYLRPHKNTVSVRNITQAFTTLFGYHPGCDAAAVTIQTAQRSNITSLSISTFHSSWIRGKCARVAGAVYGPEKGVLPGTRSRRGYLFSGHEILDTAHLRGVLSSNAPSCPKRRAGRLGRFRRTSGGDG